MSDGSAVADVEFGSLEAAAKVEAETDLARGVVDFFIFFGGIVLNLVAWYNGNNDTIYCNVGIKS